MGKKIGMSMHIALYDSVEIKLGVNKMVWSGCLFIIKKYLSLQVDACVLEIGCRPPVQ